MPDLEIPVEVDAATYAWLVQQCGGHEPQLVLKYSEDQLRDPKGRWASIAGGGAYSSKPGEEKRGPVKIVATKERAFTGEPVPGKRLSNDATGKIAEAIVQQHLIKQGFTDAKLAGEGTRGGMRDTDNATDRRYPNYDYPGGNHYAMDIYADHVAVEVKGGNISNGYSAQQWRAKILPAKLHSARRLLPEKGALLRARKAGEVFDRKDEARRWLQKDVGVKVQAVTYGVIINPKTRQADVFRFSGYHGRIGWTGKQNGRIVIDPRIEKAYVASYRY